MTIDPNALGVFVSAFLVSAFAGLAALLRSEKPLRWTGVSSALLNSGLLGLAVSLLWYHQFRENVYVLVGLCVMAGLGGMATVDFALAAFRQGGFTIRVGRDGVGLPPGEKTK